MNNLVFRSKSRLIIGSTLLASLCAMPLAANAAPFINGTGTTIDDTINSSIPDTLVFITVPADPQTRKCSVVGSLQANIPNGNASNQAYVFSVTLDGAVNGDAERAIEMRQQPGINDLDFLPVSTNDVFTLSPNVAHTIRLIGRQSPGNPTPLVVDRSTLSIVCI